MMMIIMKTMMTMMMMVMMGAVEDDGCDGGVPGTVLETPDNSPGPRRCPSSPFPL